MNTESTTRYRFRSNVLVQTDLVPAIVLDLGTGHYFEANHSAHELVLAMQHTATLAELSDCLQKAYGIEASRAIADAEVVLADWNSRGWVEPVPSEP
ncbi:MAG: PqqD family protein [Ahniella sp.]|nr:PqqD family protein [Ahniella sp.]